MAWSHRNHKEAIHERQAVLRQLPGWRDEDERIFQWSVDPSQLASFQEALTGQMVMPVSVVGPAKINLGRYAWQDGCLVETDRYQDDAVYIPLAHTEGGLSMSMQRGFHVLNRAGGVKTYLLNDMMTRDSAFVFNSGDESKAFYDWVLQEREGLAAWLNDPNHPDKQLKPSQTVADVSRHAVLLNIDAQLVGSVCHLLYRFFTGEACGPNMITRNAYALNREIVRRIEDKGWHLVNIFLEANMGGDKKPSHEHYNGGHGKTVMASAKLTHQQLRRFLNTTVDEIKRLEWTGLHGSNASGMQSFAFTPASAVAALFLTTGQDLGMVGTSSMAHATIQALPDGAAFSLQLGGIEVGTVGGGTSLPHAQSYLRLLGCQGPGSAQRLAQIIAAAALALEISASASMASHGSENFFRAHLERGGNRPT
ncbi:3-hydroxy-3-methylglutaryl-CoA reductase [Sulfobacillus harzensis]|uniref:3-hydroxy-3-methylglutaryl-CoA reductase n=1 Tax=Sulfobacillus harzensis TaxID=2729629 RepID=A0A7Y0L5G7_9FIRM|nr:3-hydroxy-3-methylglutaryl-CoA reductase [Sulfobacillus harzensis]NMP23383.1 3-hydroxy-3-methylglutaryl-CoA reductase [Sulfobacillus harzensis]